MNDRLRSFAGAVAFLTRVPVPVHPADPPGLSRSVPWFPVVGALVGVTTAAVYWLGTEVVPALPAAAVAVGAQLVVTGAFHEDGLADVADAMGGATVEERRRILHDPLHGTYGVLALVTSVVVRVGLLASLAPGDGAGALVAAHCLARGTAVAMMVPSWTADTHGLGASHTRHLSAGQRMAGTGAAVGLGGLALAAAGEPMSAPGAFVAAAAVGFVVTSAGRRALGGVSGDLLGAVEQAAEIAVLVAVVAVAA